MAADYSHGRNYRTWDDIVIALNPVVSADLEQILTLTAARRRPSVAMAFSDLTVPQWSLYAGLDDRSVCRWLVARDTRLPFGAALRLARVMGEIDLRILFADWV